MITPEICVCCGETIGSPEHPGEDCKQEVLGAIEKRKKEKHERRGLDPLSSREPLPWT